MKHILTLLAAVGIAHATFAQNSLTAAMLNDSTDNQALFGR